MPNFEAVEDVVAVEGAVNQPNVGMSAKLSRRHTWLAWGLATTLGAACGGMAIQTIPKSNFVWVAGVATFGLLVGLAQSLVLCGVIRHSGERLPALVRWTVSSISAWTCSGVAGSILIWTAGVTLYFAGTANISWFVQHGGQLQWGSITILGALTVSLLQQRILRTEIDSSARWAVASVVGWILAWTAALGLDSVIRGDGAVNGAAAGAVGGAIAGAITGCALIGILSSRTNEDGNFEGKKSPEHPSRVP